MLGVMEFAILDVSNFPFAIMRGSLVQLYRNQGGIDVSNTDVLLCDIVNMKNYCLMTVCL